MFSHNTKEFGVSCVFACVMCVCVLMILTMLVIVLEDLNDALMGKGRVLLRRDEYNVLIRDDAMNEGNVLNRGGAMSNVVD